MPPKKRLGKSLSSILAEEGRIGQNRQLSQLVPQEEPQGIVDSQLPQFDIYGSSVTRTAPEAIGEVGGMSVDYKTQFVEDARPPKENYGQGPSRSTRVAAHKFVPHNESRVDLMNRAGITGPTNNLGTVYVKFQKPGRQGQVWRYEHVPEGIYDNFSNSTSKGRYINQFLNSYNKGPAGSRDDRFHTQDFS